MYAAAGELGLPVCFMPFKGLLKHIDEIEALARAYPRTASVIDHFGFAKCGGGGGGDANSSSGGGGSSGLGSDEWRRLLALGRAHPQTYVKASAWFRVDSGGWPYAGAAAELRALVDAYGPERVVFGTDWPWVTEQCG
jgi:predicted TIM-barrel fold metal-dependent hydrolase